jgi:hypothetical protein
MKNELKEKDEKIRSLESEVQKLKDREVELMKLIEKKN